MKYYLSRLTYLSTLVISIAALAGCHSSGDTAKEVSGDPSGTVTDTLKKSDSWELLVNGKAGWHAYGRANFPNAWKVADSTLHLDASEKDGWQTKDGGDIVTDNDYENFDLKLDWKIAAGGNSGIMFYVNEDTSKYKYSWESGPELQVADNEKNEDGKIYKSRAGDVYELVASTSEKFVKPAGEWNSIEIIADRGKIDEYMNGNHVLSTMLWTDEWKKSINSTKFKDMPGFGTYRKGKIAFQDHGADVWFRNIRIKKL